MATKSMMVLSLIPLETGEIKNLYIVVIFTVDSLSNQILLLPSSIISALLSFYIPVALVQPLPCCLILANM